MSEQKGGVPAEVVAAVAAALACYLDRDPETLSLDIKGPIPVRRDEAGGFRLLGALGEASHGQR